MYKHLSAVLVVLALSLLAVSPLSAMDGPCTQCDTGSGCICEDPPPLPAIHPCWYCRTDAVFLKRDVRHSAAFAAIDDAVVFTATDLDQPFKGGAEFVIGHAFSDVFSLEASYFGLAHWDETGSVRDAGGQLDSPFTSFGNSLDPNASLFDSKYRVDVHESSRMDNGELNLLCVLPTPPGYMTTSFIVGLRYMRIGEQFDYLSYDASNPAVNVQTVTKNELWGPQIGGLFEVYARNRFWVNFEMKGAICNNASSQRTVAVVTSLPDNNSERSGNSTSFVADFSLTAVCRLTPHVTTRFGYQAIWVSDLAIAAENFSPDSQTLVNGPDWLNRHGDVLYHGPHAGLEFTW